MNIINISSEIIFRIAKPLLKILHTKGGYSANAFARKLGDFEAPDFSNNRVIMFHGVSVGEINAIEKLIKTTRQTFPDAKIVVTTGTNTGQEIAHKKLDEIADLITYFPFDTPSCVNKFLDKVEPTEILMAETEIWPNFGSICKKRGIKLYIINGRISDRTFNSYKKLKFFFLLLLVYLTIAYTFYNSFKNNNISYNKEFISFLLDNEPTELKNDSIINGEYKIYKEIFH